MSISARKVIVIFLVGLSGGAISATFPRLFTSLALPDGQIDVQLLSLGFWLLACGFAVTIAISMIWFYVESSETIKNLFLAALSLPAVLSGAINMSNTASTAQAALAGLQSDAALLAEQLENAYAIEEISPTLDTFSDFQYIEVPLGKQFDLLQLFGIASAHADALGLEEKSPSRWNPSVKFQTQVSQPEYIVSLASESDLELITKTYVDLSSKGVTNLRVAKSSDNLYFLLTGTPQNKTQALLSAVDLKAKYDINPRLIKIPR